MGDFVFICSGHSANRPHNYPDPDQAQFLHNWIMLVWSMTTIAVWLLVHTGWYLDCLKHKRLKHTPQSTAEFRNIRTTQYFKHFNKLMQFYIRMGLNCLSVKKGDTGILHYCHTVFSHQVFQHQKLLNACDEWDFSPWQRSKLKAAETLGKLSNTPPQWIYFRLTIYVVQQTINDTKEGIHALPVTSILKSSKLKQLLGFGSAGASHGWIDQLILTLMRTKSGKEVENRCEARIW